MQRLSKLLALILLSVACALQLSRVTASAPAVYSLSALESASPSARPSPAPLVFPRSSLTCDPVPLSSSDDSWRIQHQSFVQRVDHEPVAGSEEISSSWMFRGATVTDDNFRHDAAAAAEGRDSVAPADFQSRFLHKQLLASLRALAAQALGTNGSASDSGFPARDSDVYLIDVNLMWPDRDEDLARITAEYRWFAEHDQDAADDDDAGADVDPSGFQLRRRAGEFHSWPIFGSANNISMEYDDAPPQHQQFRRGSQHTSRNAELRAALLSGRPPRGYESPDHIRDRLDRLESMLSHRHREVYEQDLRAYERALQQWKRKQGDEESSSRPPPPPPSKRTVVVYVHCFCGTDRTGELMGSWALSRQERTFAQVNERNRRIGGRPMACRNYRALQLWCLEVQGQRPQHQLGCEDNHPCTVFV